MNAQTAQALQRANEIYRSGAVLRRQLKEGGSEARARAAQLLLDPPEPIQRMRVDRFLKALPRVGAHTAQVMMYDAGIHANRFIGPAARHSHSTLSERQRRVLAGVVSGR